MIADRLGTFEVSDLLRTSAEWHVTYYQIRSSMLLDRTIYLQTVLGLVLSEGSLDEFPSRRPTLLSSLRLNDGSLDERTSVTEEPS